MELLTIDNSKRTCYQTCPRKYQYLYILHIISVKGSSALRYGICFHEGMRAMYAHVAKNNWSRDGVPLLKAMEAGKKRWEEEEKRVEVEPDFRTLDTLMLAIMSYIDRFSQDDQLLKIVDAEVKFKILVEKSGLQPFYLTGGIDLEVFMNGIPWIEEFKTTRYQMESYAQKVSRSSQVYTYCWAGNKVLASPPEGAFIVIHSLTAARSRKTDEWGTPKIDFLRLPVLVSKQEIKEFEDGLIKDIISIQKDTGTGNFQQRFESCFTEFYGRFYPCEYLSLCEQRKPAEEVILGYQYKIDEVPWDVLQGLESVQVRTAEVTLT